MATLESEDPQTAYYQNEEDLADTSSGHQIDSHYKPVNSMEIEEDRSSAMHVAELQMMATQAQSTANNFTMKSIPETDGHGGYNGTNIAEQISMQTFKKDSTLGSQEEPSNAASLDSVHVGYTGIGHYGRHEPTSSKMLNSMDETANGNLVGVVVHQPEEGAASLGLTSDRFLRPKYTQIRKNNFHLRKAQGGRSKHDAVIASQDSHLAATQDPKIDLQNQLDHSANTMLDNHASGNHEGIKSHFAGTKIRARKVSPKHHSKQKPNSIDQINLKSILNSYDENSDITLYKDGSAPRKQLVESMSDTSKLLRDKRSKMEDRSRAQVLKPQVFEVPVTNANNTMHMLPTLPRNHEGLIEARNSSSVTKLVSLNQVSSEFDPGMLLKPNSRQRGSFGQLKPVKAGGQNISHDKTNSLIDVKQAQFINLPDVVGNIGGSQTQKMSTMIQRDNAQQMRIDDYNGLYSKAANQQQQESHTNSSEGFNKIQFRSADSRKNIPRQRDHREQSSVKRRLITNQDSALKIVKRQQDKFSIQCSEDQLSPPSYISKYDKMAAELPSKVYHSSSQTVTRRVQPSSAIMQQLLANTKKSSSNLTSTDKLHNELSNCPSQLKDSVHRVDLGEKKRIRAAQEKISLAEIAVTNAQNSNALTSREIEQMLQAYVQSLQNTVILANAGHTALTTNLQSFVQQCVNGIQHSARLRQKLLDEQIQQFDKSKEQFQNKIERRDTKMTLMQTELNSRPYQKHFRSEEELEEEIEDLRKLTMERNRMTKGVEESHYSGAEDELDKLSNVFKTIHNMGIANISCSYVDKALFTDKLETVGAIGKEIKTEGNTAMRETAKRVLNKFWRYYTTSTASTQTEEKVIDSLKLTIQQQKENLQEIRRKVGVLENKNIDLETEADRYKAISELARKAQKEKEDELQDTEDAKEQMLSEINELKEKEKTLVARFQHFADEVSNLKQANSNANDQLRETQAALRAKEIAIKQMGVFTSPFTGSPPKETEALDASAVQAVLENDEAGDHSDEVVPEAKIKKSTSKKKLSKSKKGKKGAGAIKKVASTASIDDINAKIKEKLDPELEDRWKRQIADIVRAETLEEAEHKITKSISDAKKSVDAAEQSKNALTRIKQKRIDELEDIVGDKDKTIRELKQQLGMPMTAVVPELDEPNSPDSVNQSNKKGKNQAKKPSKGAAGSKNTRVAVKSVEKQETQTAGGRDSETQALELSAAQSSQFSLKQMQPKGFAASNAFQRGDSNDPVASEYGMTYGVDSLTPNPIAESSGMQGEGEGLSENKKTGIRTTDFSPQPTIKVNGSVGDAYGINLENKAGQGGDKAQGSKRNTKKTVQTGGTNKKRKVSQGSQVEDQLLETVYIDDPMAYPMAEQIIDYIGPSDDNSQGLNREISHTMMEKYDGHITGGTQDGTDSPQIVNIPITAHLNRNYGNVINSFSNDVNGNKASDERRAASLETMSDQTLYKQEVGHETTSGGRDSVVKMGRQATTLQKLQRPKVDMPSNLVMESKQYQQRNASSIVKMGGRRMPSEAPILSTSRLEDRALVEGDKILSEHLSGLLPNHKLEKFQHLVEKAYGGKTHDRSAKHLLDSAKEQLEGTELKILMLMLQMRGQFDRTGAPMLMKGSQTDGVIITNNSRQLLKQKQRDSKSLTHLQPQLQGIVNGNQAPATGNSHEMSMRLLHASGLTDEEQLLMDNPMVGYVTVSSRMPLVTHRMPEKVDIGVQADTDLIKVAIDRITLMEKNKRMFYASSGRQQHVSADKFTHVGGSFSPAPKQSKQPAALRAEELKDFGTNDRVMKPSLRQQKQSREFAAEKQFQAQKYQLQMESMRHDTIRPQIIQKNVSVEKLQNISVDLANIIEQSNIDHSATMDTKNRSPRPQLMTLTSPAQATPKTIHLAHQVEHQDSNYTINSQNSPPLKKVFQKQSTFKQEEGETLSPE